MKLRLVLIAAVVALISAGPIVWSVRGATAADAANQAPSPSRARVATSPCAHVLASRMLKEYAASHPDVTFEVTCPEPGEPAGEADLVLLVRVSDEAVRTWTSRGFSELFRGSAIGHNSYAVLVDPRCPLKELSLSDLRSLLSGGIRTWRHFALPGGSIRVVVDSWARAHVRPFIKVGDPSFKVTAAATPQAAALAVAGDPEAVCVISTRPWLPDTGLRPVRLTGEPIGDVTVPAERLSILCPAGASPATRRVGRFFWEQLARRPEAGTARWARRYGARPAEQVWPEPGGSAPAPPGNVAVACLEVQPKLKYFLTVTPEWAGRYDAQLEEAMASLAGLTIVDRRQLRRLLAEWEIDLFAGRQADRAKTMVAADVVIEPTLIDDNQHGYLSVRAIHVQTGTLLGRMRLVIDPRGEGKCAIDIGPRVRAWWPGVAGNLHRARTLPIVWVRVAGRTPGAIRRAPALQQDLCRALGERGSCYAAPGQTTFRAQTESLLKAMGLAAHLAPARPEAFDYVLDVQLLADHRARVHWVDCVEGTRGEPVLLGATSSAALAEAIRARAVACARTCRRPSDKTAVAGRREDWFAGQAAVAFRAAEADDPAIAAAMKDLPRDDPAYLALAGDRVRRYLAAYHLDPINEEIAWRLVQLAGSLGDRELDESADLRQAAGRYLLSFPQTRRKISHDMTTIYQGLVTYYSTGIGESFRHTGFPKYLEKPHLRLPELRARLQAYPAVTKWLIRKSVGASDRNVQELPRWLTEHYLLALVEYLHVTKASDKQVALAVATWAGKYDAYPRVVPPSGFVRMGFLCAQGRKRQALEHLAGLIRQRPDPKDKFWTFFKRDTVSGFLVETDQHLRNEVNKWLKGERDTAGLLELARQRIRALPAE